MARVALLLAITLGLSLGVLSFATGPARAIELNNITFLGCPARFCPVPFTMEVQVTVSGSPPFTGVFTWGDGTNLTSYSNNGTTSSFDVSHQYTVKGNYSLRIILRGADGAQWQSTYKVSALGGSFLGTATVRAWIEGQGYVNQLYRKDSDQETITAYVQNTGSAYFGPVTVTFMAGGGSGALCDVASFNALVPGGAGYVVWNPVHAGVISCTINHLTPVWVYVKSSSVPAMNVSSPKMIVNWSTTTPAAGVTVVASTYNTAGPTGGFTQPITYYIKNTGTFSVDVHGSPTQSVTGALALYPNDLGQPADSLVVNGSQQQALLGTYALFQGVGRAIIQPGETLSVNRSLLALGAITATPGQSTAVTLTDLLDPLCPIPTTSERGTPIDASFWCGFSVMPNNPSISVTVTITAQGASIYMVAAVNLGNGTVQFVGQITAIAPGSGTLSTEFDFWKTANVSTLASIAGQPMSSPGQVTAVASGLSPKTNYSVQFVVKNPSVTIASNVILFVSGSGPGTGGSTGNPTQTFTDAWLFWVASSAGVPMEIIGFAVGMAILGFTLFAVLLIASKVDLDIPPELFVGVLLVCLIVNVGLFLWPSWSLAIVIVAEALLLWDRYSARGSAGGAGG